MAFMIALFLLPLALANAAGDAAGNSDHLQLMIPGPIEFHEDVLAAAGGLAVSHVAPSFLLEFGEAIELMREVVLTKNGQPFITAGSGTLGWDMAAVNLIEPGEEVLVLNTGVFGDRFADCLETYGAQVTHVRAPIGGRPAMAEIEAALMMPQGGKPFKAVTITQVDTSTGVLMDVKAIAELVKAKSPDTLIVVDGVCSVGAERLLMDEWGIDAVITASQKAIGVPPGLCIVVASERAMGIVESRQTPIANYFASIKRWLPIMQAYENREAKYFATPPVQLIQALRVSLKQILAQSSMEERFGVHEKVSDRVKDAVERKWGLKLVPKTHEGAAHSMTAIYYPQGMAPTDLLPKIVARGVMVAGGLHPEIATKYFRVGHMHISATEPGRHHIDITLAAIEAALKEAGHKFPDGKDEL